MPGTEFVTASSVAEAVDALAGADAIAVSGGTAVALLLKHRLISPRRLVWLGRLRELREVRELAGGGVAIGAATTLAELAASPLVAACHPVLAQAAAGIGNVRVRAVATVGGHAAHADPRQDLPPVLLALGAELVVTGGHGERRIPAEDFFRGHLETALEPGELITAVELPPPRPGQRSAYLRFTPGSEDDYPTIAVAATLRPDGLRIGIAGIAGRPLLIAGEEDLEAAAPAGDRRGSSAYRRAMARLFTRRAIAAVGG